MTYKALIKTAESYLYDAQSDLQVLTKRSSENHPRVFSDTLKSVEYALNDIERIHDNAGLYETGELIGTAVTKIDLGVRLVNGAERACDRLSIAGALLRAKKNLKEAKATLFW